MAPDAPGRIRRCCGCCCSCLFATVVCLTKHFIYWRIWFVCEREQPWAAVYDPPDDWRCNHPALPVNNSGVEVIVAGLAKTGTRSMSRALWKMGYNHSYHSEELALHVWSPIADEYWRQHGLPRSQTAHPVSGMKEDDIAVLKSLSAERWAHDLSKCRADALAFDGLEWLTSISYEASPDAKVILLNWRSWDGWQKSHLDFAVLLLVYTWFLGMLHGSFAMLPWGRLMYVVDPLFGNELYNLMTSGGPPINQVYTPLTRILHNQLGFRRIMSHWMSGLHFIPQRKEDYEAFWDHFKKTVPKENLLEYDIKHDGWEKLCSFLGTKRAPNGRCPGSGPIERAINALNFERDFPWSAIKVTPIYLFAHWINWKIYTFVLSIPFKCWRWLRGKPEKKD